MMSPRKSGQQELTREMIMDAARDLFMKKGYQNVSMRQIATVLGCSHGSIYYHFINKAELFYALVKEHFRVLDSKLDDMMQQEMNNNDKLHHILLGFIEFGLNNQSHYEIMFLIKDTEVRYFINEGPATSYDKFAKSVNSLCRSTSIHDIWSIFLSLHGFVSHYIGHVNEFDEVKEIANAHVKFLLKSIV
jgi:AcrR family transcriptional regulator